MYGNILEVEDCEFVPVQWTLDSVHRPRMKFSLVDNWKCSGGWGLGVLIAGTQVRWTSNWGTITIYHPTQPPPYQNQQPPWHINTNKKLNFYMYVYWLFRIDAAIIPWALIHTAPNFLRIGIEWRGGFLNCLSVIVSPSNWFPEIFVLVAPFRAAYD